jgi:hypothetical protein
MKLQEVLAVTVIRELDRVGESRLLESGIKTEVGIKLDEKQTNRQ